MPDANGVLPAAKPSFSTRVVYLVSIVTILVAAILILFGLNNLVQNNKQQETLDQQISKTNSLIEQVKELAQQNRELSQRSVNYSYCNSVIIARYTQTGQPILVDDLNECIITSFPNGVGAPTPEGGTSINTDPQGSSTPRSTNGTTSAPNSTGTFVPGGTATPTSPTPVTPQQTAPLLQMQGSNLVPDTSLTLPCVNALGIRIAC